MKHIRHPWEIRMFHWLFVVVTILKTWSGLYISHPHPFWGFSDMYSARMLHAVMTPVLAALLTFRLYYAVLSGDWRDAVLWRRSDLKEAVPWLRRFLFFHDSPGAVHAKYNFGQKFIFTAIYLTMPLFFITGLVLLNMPPFRFLNILTGGQGISRIAHYLGTVALISIVAVHIYLALTSSVDRLKSIFTGRLPRKTRP